MQHIIKSINNKVAFILLINLTVTLLVYLAFYKTHIVMLLPANKNLIRWDAAFYQEIKDIGYVYLPNQPSNMAFFPFFPLMWKLSGLSAMGISILNMLLFNVSLCFLIGRNALDAKYILALVTLPCFIFFYLPYSEGLFFLFGVLLILGYKEKIGWLVILGILGCCLTRAVSTVFIPILLVTELLYWKRSGQKPNYKVIIHCLVAGLAILFTVVMQGIQTGKWFFYLEAARYFNRQLTMPGFPFTTLSPEKILGTDSLAWFVGSVAAFFCIKWGVLCLKDLFSKRSNAENSPVDRSIYFSALFLSAIFIIDTFFTNKIDGQTNLWSINRHLLCTPFAIHFILWFYRDYKKEKYDLYFIILLLLTSLFVIGIFQYAIHLSFFLLVIAALFLSKFFKWADLALYPLYAFNLILWIIYYQDYLLIKWVG